MVTVSENAAKYSAATRTIKVKDVYIKGNCLCDDEGNDVLDRIAEQLPDSSAAISFNLKFEVPED